MADELKRVGLVFKEEGAVDFKKTLTEINLELNKNYNQFKLTQAQWDSSTKSTEKLKAQQEYLTNAYEIQQDKVNALKMQLADLENAEEKNTSAIKKKRNELLNAEVKLEKYGSELEAVKAKLNNFGIKAEEVGEKLQKSGNKIENAGKKVSAFSAATGAALVACAKGAIDFEDAFTGVEKTVDGTEEQLAELKQGIRDMAKELPSSTTEIAGVAEAAGQLGIKTEDILSFTKVMIDLGNSTNLSANEAASSLAKFANVTKMSSKDYSKLGSTIVDLGNNFATTESDIVSMATRLAATGDLAGLSQPQILALATAMSSVGIEAEAGGSAMSKLLKKIQVAVETGSGDLKQFAKVAGMSTKDFKKAFEKDAVGALSLFIGGLNDTKRNGKSAISILEDMNIKEIRLSNTILSLANSGNLMNKAIKLGNDAWENNTALTNEANKRYDTLKSKIEIAWNKIKDLAITIGDKLTPVISKAVDKIEDLTKWVSNLTDEQVEWIVKIAATVTALGPLLTVIGKVTSTMGTAIKGIGNFSQAIGVMQGTVTTSSVAVNGLASVMTAILNPMTLLAVGIGAVTACCIAYHKSVAEDSEALKQLKKEVDNQTTSWEKLKETRQESLANNMSEIENCEKLVKELESITYANGEVKKGYETRANTIITLLNKALGTEITMTDNVISKYSDLRGEIDKVIASKKAEALLSAYQEEYTTALKKQGEATETLVGLKQQLIEVSEKMKNGNTLEKISAEQTYNSISEKIRIQMGLISEYGYTIEKYENLQAASVEGSTEKINKALESLSTSYKIAKEKNNKSLEEQITQQGEYVKYLKESLEIAKNNNDEYSQEILKKQLETSQKQMSNLAQNLAEQTSTVQKLTPEQIKAWKTLASQSSVNYMNELSQLPDKTKKQIQDATGVVIYDTSLNNAFKSKGANSTRDFQKELNISGKTKEELTGTANALYSSWSVENASSQLGIRTQSKFEDNADGNSAGKNFTRGVKTGLSNQNEVNGAVSASGSLGAKILKKFKDILGIHSPSKEAEEAMEYYLEGIIVGITRNENKAIESVGDLAKEINNELTSELNATYSLGDKPSYKISKKAINDWDYNKLSNVIYDAFIKALTGCKLSLDEEGFIKLVKEELYKVV